MDNEPNDDNDNDTKELNNLKNYNNNYSINSSYISSSSSGESEENNNYEDYQGTYTSPSEDIINEEIQLKENHIIKIIKEQGNSLYKPKEIDDIIIKCFSYYYNENKGKIMIKNFCEFNGDKEINLGDKSLPRSLALCIESMRINEFAIFKIKFNYIFRFLDTDKKNDKIYTDIIDNKELFDDNFRKKNFNEKIFFEVKLINYFSIKNITKNGEIKKKNIFKENNNSSNSTPNESDIITLNLKCVYKKQEIYNYNNKSFELDLSYYNNEITDIELYLIKNSKLKEKNIFAIEYNYLTQKYKKFLDKYPKFLMANLKIETNDNNSNNDLVEFYIEIINIEKYIYIYKYKNKNNAFAKMKILKEGFGLACPDEEMFVKFKFLLKIDGEILYNSFPGFIDIERDYISSKNEKMLNEVINWRNKMNEEYDIKYLDQEIDYIKSESIYNKLSFDNLISLDMNDYSFASVIRKVLCTMKRNEIKYIKCDYIDYIQYDTLKLYDIKNKKIEIYIHLYDFREMPLFGKYSYEDKLRLITYYKTIADDCYKNGIKNNNGKGNIFRAMKIYNKLMHRFSGGDVFGHDRLAAEKYLKKINEELYNKLINIRINIYNNLGVTFLKLEKYNSCYFITKQILDLFDNKNIKALYLYGKTSFFLKYYEESINIFKKIKELQPDNKEVENDIKLAEDKYKENISIQNNLYKKMFKGNI